MIADAAKLVESMDSLEKPSKYILTCLKKGFKDFTSKSEIDLGYAFEEYLESSCRKIKSVKTFLYKRTPKDLRDIYVCAGIQWESRTISTNLVGNVIEAGHKVIITGTAGIGKTTMLKSFFLDTAEKTLFIPVFIELRNIENGATLYDSIYDALNNHDIHFIKKEYFDYSMIKGCYLLLLDGFDELSSEKAKKIEHEIQMITTKYPENYYILTSRPLSIFQGWGDFIEMQAAPLSKEQAIELIKKLDYDEKPKDAFIKVLDERLFNSHRSFASNPLLLTIMFITYTDRGRYVPDELNTFYEEAFAALFELHDNYKGLYKRDIETGLSREEFKRIFSYLCFKTFFDNKQTLTDSELRGYLERARVKIPDIKFSIDLMIRDLTIAVCMLVKDGLFYTFVHKSFQEYFAACYTAGLTDEVQNEVIKESFRKGIHNAEEIYYKMLYSMQPGKMDESILMKNLEPLKNMYSNGFNIDFLKKVSSGIGVRIGNSNRRDKYYISLNVYKNMHVFFEMIKLVCSLRGYSFDNENINEKDFEDYLDKKVLNLEEQGGGCFYYEEIIFDGMEEMILKQLFWFRNRCEFALKYLDSHDFRYKEGSNIIDEL